MKDKMQIMKALKLIFSAMLVAVLLFFVLGEVLLPKDNLSEQEECELFQADWVRELPDGSTEPVEIPGKCKANRNELVRVTTVLPQNQKDAWFCIRSSQQDMQIYIGDELRQEYSTAGQRLFGINSPSAYVFFRVYERDAGKELAIEAVSDSTYTGVLGDIHTGDQSGIWKQFLKQYSIILMVSIFMLILSAITILYSTMLSYVAKTKVEISYLGWGLLLASLWLLANSRIRQFLLPNITVASNVGFWAVMLLPYPFLIYVNQVQKGRYQKFYLIVAVSTIVNFVVSTALHVLNIVDFLDTMIISHIILIALVLLAGVTMLLDVRSGKIKEYRAVAMGVVGLMAAAGWEVYLVYHPNTSYSGLALCIGLMFLLFTAGCKTGIDLINQEKEKQMAIIAGQSKSRFLANMSHEIRTPINTVIGMNEMILRENKNESIREYAQNIQNASQLLLGLINDILDFSKVEAGKLDIIESEYPVSVMLVDVIQGVSFKSESKNLKMNLNIAEDLPCVLKGDEIRIKQILNNLLTNAIKYTRQGSVTLTVKPQGTKENFILFISVEDTGIGMKQKDMKRLFDSFLRLDEKKNRHIEGSGLGLAITRQLVELMGGSIEVQSEYEKGSCFTVHIPQQIVDDNGMGKLYDAYKREMAKKKEDKKLLFAPTAQILVVDDTKMNLSVVKALLKRTGVLIDLATGGKACLELCREKVYDLILMDHMMPEPDGIETLHLLQKDEESLNRNTKVVVLTANAIAGVAQQYLTEGFVDYLSKPLVSEDLEAILIKHLPSDKQQLMDKQQLEELQTRQQQPPNEQVASDLTEIDTRLGLCYCSESRELYGEVLKEYCKQAEDYMEKLSRYYTERNWADYRIIVHAVKGTSLTIGAEKLSRKAKDLEMAASENREELLLSESEAFLQSYREVVKQAKLLGEKNA